MCVFTCTEVESDKTRGYCGFSNKSKATIESRVAKDVSVRYFFDFHNSCQQQTIITAKLNFVTNRPFVLFHLKIGARRYLDGRLERRSLCVS